MLENNGNISKIDFAVSIYISGEEVAEALHRHFTGAGGAAGGCGGNGGRAVFEPADRRGPVAVFGNGHDAFLNNFIDREFYLCGDDGWVQIDQSEYLQE